MSGRIRRHLRANVIGYAALFVAMSGVAYAGTPNSVVSGDIVNGEVKHPDIASNNVRSAEVINDTFTGGGLAAVDLQAGSVGASEVLDESLAATDLGTSSVGQSEIATDGVGASEIQDDSIDSGEIVDFSLSNQDVGVLFAEVNGNGTLANSSGGGVTVTKIAGFTGNYEVDFARDVTACTSVATIGPAGGGSAIGEVNVADRGGNAEAVFVDTNTSAGTAADLPFRLVLVC